MGLLKTLTLNGKTYTLAPSVLATSVTLLAGNWVGDTSPYSQTVVIEGVGPMSKVDLQPTIDQLAIFHEKDLAFTAENDGGSITIYAVGDKPSRDYTLQVTITEVVA